MENKELFVDKLLCASCLCLERTLHNVTDTKMQRYYFGILNEIPLCDTPPQCLSMCFECAARLRNAVAFREQVKDSYRILHTYTRENLYECLLTDITRPPRLKVHRTDSLSIEPASQPAEVADDDGTYNKHEDLDKQEDLRENLALVYLKDEVKVEFDNVFDDCVSFDECGPLLENPDALTEIKNDIDAEITRALLPNKRRRKKSSKTEDKVRKAKKIIKRLKTENKVNSTTELGIITRDAASREHKTKKIKDEKGQRILTIELSYEDMLLERDSDSRKESFVNAQYKCDSCLLGFNYEKSYKAHISAKHSLDLGDYSCPICKTIISSVESFTAHYKRHMKRYQCSICQKRSIDKKVIIQHYHSAHEMSLKQYQCKECGKVSNSIDTHRYHMDSHKARVQCSKCDKTFTHRSGLLNHRLAVHELKNEFPCTLCDKVFRWKNSLKRHLEKHDSRSNTNVAFCAPCDISFSSVSSFNRHLKNSMKHVAPNQLRYICDHCNRRFADKTKLRDHIEEKHLNRTYQCDICSKSSKNRVGLDQHIRNVHKGRPNNKICHHCGKGFPTKLQLESHIRTHTGERPFICELCPTTFSQQSNLYKHNKQVHLNIKSKRYPTTKKRKEEVTAPPYTIQATLQYSPDYIM